MQKEKHLMLDRKAMGVKQTRAEYMALPYDPELSAERHQAYYSQFVTSEELELVRRKFGERIAASSDEHFNDIPLIEWDRMDISHESKRLLSAANNGRAGFLTYSLSDSVCVLKAAARIIKRENTNAD